MSGNPGGGPGSSGPPHKPPRKTKPPKPPKPSKPPKPGKKPKQPKPPKPPKPGKKPGSPKPGKSSSPGKAPTLSGVLKSKPVIAGLALFIAAGGTTLGLKLLGSKPKPSCPANSVCIKPSSGKQGTKVAVTYNTSAPSPPSGYWAYFTDPSTHIVYRQPALPGKSSHGKLTVVAPWEPCEQARQAQQATPPQNGVATGGNIPLMVAVGAVPGTGENAPALKPAPFTLKCKSGTVVAYADPPAPDPVDPDGVSTSTITVHVYTVWIDTDNISQPAGGWVPGDNSGVHVDPLGGVTVRFSTDLGTFATDTVVTNAAGAASDTISSSDAGIANVTPTVKDRVSTGSLNSAVNKVVAPAPSANPLPTQYTPIPVHFPPHLAPIAAVFDDSTYTTTYTEMPVAPASGLTYQWSVNIPTDPGCASGFTGNSPQKNQASWFHKDTSQGGPCDHNVTGASGHPGTVTVTVTAAHWTCTATVVGTITENGPAPPACTQN